MKKFRFAFVLILFSVFEISAQVREVFSPAPWEKIPTEGDSNVQAGTGGRAKTNSSSKKNEKKKIRINSARSTEYGKAEAAPAVTKAGAADAAGKGEGAENSAEAGKEKSSSEKDEIIIFTGNVSVSVSDSSSTSTIYADKIIYNKTRSTLEASGNVRYERKIGNSPGESFTGELLIFNIEKMKGVFLNGVVQQASNKKGRDPFSIFTYIAGKDESGVVGFKNGLLTTSKEGERDPLWSIRASRIWLLPGSEMAFANGFLSVGVVPLLYIPFFYYPADEMLFHPVFGFKNREGAFIQTTTYIIGRKPLPPRSEGGSSFSNFLQGDTLKEQKLEGLFFKKLDGDAPVQDPNYLKVVADVYSGLGYLVGVDGKFAPKKGYVRQVNFSSYFGFSKTLYPSGGKDSRHSIFAAHKKEQKLNRSNLFGKFVPLRYSFNFDMSVTRSPFNVNISFPFISDPYFKQDFLNRSEDMNWFNYLLNKDKLAKVKDGKFNEETYYNWRVNGSIRPSFPAISPWISSVSLDEISLMLNFSSKDNNDLTGLDTSYSPERKFYFPQRLKPDLKLSVSGTIFSTSMLGKKKPAAASSPQTAEVLRGIKNPFTPNDETSEKKELSKNEGTADVAAASESEADKKRAIAKKKREEEKAKAEKLEMELLDGAIPIYKIPSPVSRDLSTLVQYSLGYRTNGQFLHETTFDYEEWKKPEDINWKKLQSRYYQLKGDFSLDSSLTFYQGLIGITNSFVITGNYQKHPWIKDSLKSKEESFKLNNYKANVYSLRNTNTVKLTPFIMTEHFKPVSFSWTISEILIQNKFTGTFKSPKWETEKVKWKKEFIKTHSAAAVLGFTVDKYTQALNFSMNLPPLLASYSGSAAFNFPYGNLNMSTRLFEKEKDKKKWFWDPFKMTLSFSFPLNIRLSQEYIYNIEDKKSDRLAVNFSWKYVSAFYIMNREIPYELKTGSGWIPKGKDKKFIPSSACINFSNSSSPFEIYAWKNRVSMQTYFSSSLNFNLVRVTDSYFTFSPKLVFKIYQFLDISFGATSRNDSIARYFSKAFNLPDELPGEKNIFKDLANSFYFWDKQKRESSGFKLKSIDFELTHYLKDWTMKFSYSVKPVLKREGGKRYFSFDPKISFFVQWTPIGDIKVTAKKEEKKFSVERGEIK